MSVNWINASEIAEYLYCNRAWWLKRVMDAPSQNVRELEQGETFHDEHASTVVQAQTNRRFAYLFVLLALFLLAAGALFL